MNRDVCRLNENNKVALPFVALRIKWEKVAIKISSWNIHITMCKTVSGKLLCNKGAQPSVLWWPRGMEWGRRVGGRFKTEGIYVCLWLIHIVVWQKPTQHCKAIILQLKINLKNHFPRNVWVYFWTLNSILLAYTSFFFFLIHLSLCQYHMVLTTVVVQ